MPSSFNTISNVSAPVNGVILIALTADDRCSVTFKFSSDLLTDLISSQ